MLQHEGTLRTVREPDIKGHAVCDSIDRKRQEQENPETGSGL
jgi:hypothetical protein